MGGHKNKARHSSSSTMHRNPMKSGIFVAAVVSLLIDAAHIRASSHWLRGDVEVLRGPPLPPQAI